MWEEDKKRQAEAFSMTCKKCGSDDVSFDCEMENDRSGEGESYRYAILRFTCHGCNDNHLVLYP